MKKYTILFLVLLVSTLALAQKKEKIKGSKIVTIEQKEIGDFDTIEISDNLEVYLERGEKCELKIEADDNLHDIINIDLTAKTLRINSSKIATNYKKFSIRITYTNELKMISSKDEAVINAIQEIQLNDFSIQSFDDSKLFLNVNTKNFILESDAGRDRRRTALRARRRDRAARLPVARRIAVVPARRSRGARAAGRVPLRRVVRLCLSR